MNKVKYPLTDEARELARTLVNKWQASDIGQLLHFFSIPHSRGIPNLKRWKVEGLERDFYNYSYKELALFGLVSIDAEGIMLMQELVNAVESDFVVSDYFLTMNAVGTIIYGDTTISAPFQSSAAINSQVSQSQEVTQTDIAEKLLEGLGETFLKAHEPIAEAIKSLKDEPEKSFKQKLGIVISELGNSMQHGANAYVVMQAIATITPYLQHM